MTVYVAQMLMAVLSQIICGKRSLSKKIKKISLFVTILFLVVISAFRCNIGEDYMHYVNLYNTASLHGSQGFYTEPGFNILLMVLTKIGFPAQSLFVVSSILLGVALWFFLTQCVGERYWGLAIFLFVSFGFYFSSLNILRQYMAFSIGLFALVSLKKSNIKTFTILLIIATSFHAAAIFLFAVPLFSRLARAKQGFWIIITLYILSLVFIVLDIRPIVAWFSSFINRWSEYASSSYFTEKNASAILKLLVPNLLAVWYFISCKGKVLSLSNYSFGKWCDIEIAGVLYILFQNVFSGIMVLTRISEMFGMCFILWVLGVVARNKDNSTKKLFEFLLYVYGFVLTSVTIFQMNGYGVMPYQSIF